MWIDYAIYLTTAIAVISLLLLIWVQARRTGTTALRAVLLGLLVVSLAAAAFLSPERFRETGPELLIVEVDGRPQTEVELIGLCISIFRTVGPLSFIVGNDLFPGDDWDRGPVNGCDASGHSGALNLPESARTGSWLLCDYATCHRLVREA